MLLFSMLPPLAILFSASPTSSTPLHPLLPRDIASSSLTSITPHSTATSLVEELTFSSNSIIIRAAIGGAAGLFGLLLTLLGVWMFLRRRKRMKRAAAGTFPIQPPPVREKTRREKKKREEDDKQEGEGESVGYVVKELGSPRVEPYCYTSPSRPATQPTLLEETDFIQELAAAQEPVYWNRNEGLDISEFEPSTSSEPAPTSTMGPPQTRNASTSESSSHSPRVKR